MDTYEPFLSLGLALASGFLIGQEREYSAPEPRESRESFFGGSRTYPLVSLAGAASVLVARQFGPWLMLMSLAALGALLVVSYAEDVRRGRSHGLTSEVALLLSYLLGALALTQGVLEPLRVKVLVVAGLTVVATTLLSMKPVLHAFLGRLQRRDVSAVVQLLFVAVVVVPLLPDATYGPLDVLNPRQLGWLTLLIAGIGFAGYVAIQALGPSRGLVVTGLIGGLVSSTAVTLSFAGRAKGASRELRQGCALAVMLASSLMFVRVLVEVAVVNPPMVRLVAVPMGAMAFTLLTASLLLYRRAREVRAEGSEVQFANPFALGSALKFTVLFAVVLLGARAATEFLGHGGAYLAGLLAGLTDVDAITLSMANLARTAALPEEVAVTTIFLGTASNTLAKGVMAAVVGGWSFGRWLLLVFGATLAVGALALVAVGWS
ncbi:MgtC/SapB family protein [Archangium lansingense]|uniref:MgtC/SapB family protein n=1 Tax=Archangium lansingense TaxID=2995310 RepID=UPI003B776BC2